MILPYHERTNHVMELMLDEMANTRDVLPRGGHLVLAIIREGTTTTSKKFCEKGANLIEARRRYQKFRAPSLKVNVMLKSTLIARFLDLGVKQATDLGDEEVCPIHLLLGLAADENPDLAVIMKSFNITDPVAFYQNLVKDYLEKKNYQKTLVELRARIAHLEGFLRDRNLTP